MLYNKKPTVIRLVAILLVFFFVLPINVNGIAAENVSTRASYYLSSYNTYLYNAAFGKIQVYFDVTGVHYMDEIGVLTIQIFESIDNQNWTWVETYKHDSTSGMLGYNKVYYSGHVDYQGTIGRYYKAYVTIWAGKDGSGDTRYMWTQPQKATLLPG